MKLNKINTVHALAATIVGACGMLMMPHHVQAATYSQNAANALTSLVNNFYDNGKWRVLPNGTTTNNHDWGADSLTFSLYFRWLVNGHDTTVPPMLDQLAASMNTPPSPCTTTSGCGPWSDEYLWDSIAGAREYEVTGNTTALSKAKAGFDYVDKAGSSVWAAGACPAILYQRPDRGTGGLKTNETDSNYIKAAILLYKRTNDVTYLNKAKTAYASNRQWYLDQNGSNLYSVYVYDTNGQCRQEVGRYFGSVQGNMIYSGMKLYQITGVASYLNDAIATAKAVDSTLSDPSGIYVNLQAENDLVEPLVEAMYGLWAEQQQTFAKDWIMRNAAAAATTVTANGAYGRFFNGPKTAGIISQFQANGGYALAFAAAAIDPNGTVPSTTSAWDSANMHATNITTTSLPASITFTGTGIALIGTIGENCCEAGHARVFVDGVETKDTTGIWQNKSSSGTSLPNSVLFAWTWPTSGTHTVQIQPGVKTGKEGDSFVHIQYYKVRDEVGGPAPMYRLEAENLTVAASSTGDVVRVAPDNGYSSGNGLILEGNTVNDFVSLTGNVPRSGTYKVEVVYKSGTNRGIWQLAVDGSNVGSPVDGYPSGTGSSFVNANLGNVTLSAGNHTFKFNMVGTSGTAYWAAIDYIQLTPQ